MQTKNDNKDALKNSEAKKNDECFIIMPISDPQGYDKGHFRHVFSNIIVPACDAAKLKAVRADDVKQTNLIHIDILKRLLETPIAICDLSSQNPNVLFELGLRQAFDKPVVLIQEKDTPKIFDISPLRYLEYSAEMKYHEVLEIQKRLTEMLLATKEAVNDVSDVNSIVKLLSLSEAAKIPKLESEGKEDLQLALIRSELMELRQIMLDNRALSDRYNRGNEIRNREYRDRSNYERENFEKYREIFAQYESLDVSEVGDSTNLSVYVSMLDDLSNTIEAKIGSIRTPSVKDKMMTLSTQIRTLRNNWREVLERGKPLK